VNIFKVYSIVGTTRAASFADQRAAYRRKAMTIHPDRNPEGGADQFADLNAAWSRIKNPQAAAKLTMEYHMLGLRCVPCGGDGIRRKQLSFTRSTTTTCEICEGCGYIARRSES